MDLLVVSVVFFLSPLLSLGSIDRSHNAPTFVFASMLVDESLIL